MTIATKKKRNPFGLLKNKTDFKFQTLMKMRAHQDVKKSVAAQCVDVAPRTARRWAKQGPPQKRGRKPKNKAERTTKMVLLASETKTRKGRSIPLYPTAARVSAGLKKKFGIRCSKATVLRDLKRVGVVSRVRGRHPALFNAEKRLAFAMKWKQENPDKNVFSDEHFISVNDNSIPRMFVQKGTRAIPRSCQRMQNVPRYHVWGAVGIGWRSPLIIFPKFKEKAPGQRGAPKAYRLNAADYIGKVLSKPGIKKHISKRDIVFMHDGARAHKAKIVSAWMRANKIRVMSGFPAYSPDFNPIECVWSELNTLIAEEMPTTEKELLRAARKAWKAIPQEHIDNHIRHFRTVRETVAANGGI